MKKLLILFLIICLASCSNNRSGDITILSTNDVHGTYFPQSFVDTIYKYPSLCQVSETVKEYRDSLGDNHVLLFDIGDGYQGTNASYYANFVDSTSSKHLFSRIVNYMKYDVLVVGNHDIEAGHPVYDRISKEIDASYLACNAISREKKRSYFEPYTIIRKNNMKIAVIGATSPAIASWVSPDKWEGMVFIPIKECVEMYVKEVKKKEHPDFIIVAIHAGVGQGDALNIEQCGEFLAKNLQGIDVIMASHDHIPYINKIYNGQDSVLLIDGGCKSKYISKINLNLKDSASIITKNVSGCLLHTDIHKLDKDYLNTFRPDYNKIKKFSNAEIGFLNQDLDFSKALNSSCDYMKFIHFIQMKYSDSELSIAAPLNTKGFIHKGKLVYNDLFRLYRFENSLESINMTGKEVKDYLENSYDYQLKEKGFYFNYDSMAGLNYTVDKSKENGHRINIISMADGGNFNSTKLYKVAINSYRVNGGGGLLSSVGLNRKILNNRIIKNYPEIRNCIYNYIKENKTINIEEIENNYHIGSWKFVD
ncbi:MAG: bifunctional UDP-sugar hydrolase/5'-nucleotidase [Bacteroidales bacterium]